MAADKHHLEVDESGPADYLRVGDRFVQPGGRDEREHIVTQDLGSHFEYDGRPNKRLSKDTMVRRVGEHDPGERTERAVRAFANAVQSLERTGDVARWASDMTNVITRLATYGMDDLILPVEKLEKQGVATFAKVKPSRGRDAVSALSPADRKRWAADVQAIQSAIRGALLEDVIRGIVREAFGW